MNFFRAIYISVLLIPILWQCTERIEVEVDSTYTRLVVEGYLTTDTMQHTVKLTTTGDYFLNRPADPVRNADVKITDSENLYQLSESPDNPGFYLTEPDVSGIPGRTYTLIISNVDVNQDGVLEEYTAASRLPQVNSLDSIQLDLLEGTHFKIYQVRVYAWDPPTTDFYAFKVYKNRLLLTDTLYELIVQDDAFFNGNYTYGIPSQFLDQSKEEEILEPGDTVTFELNGITEEYYNYIVEAQSEVFRQTPLFSGPPANISSNISNGAVGFFAAYSTKRSSVVFTGE